MSRPLVSELIRRASSNHGIIDIDRITSIGIEARCRQRLVNDGIIQRVVPGIYVLTGTPLDWERRLRIGLRQVAPLGAAAFATAARLWDLPGFGPARIEVITPRDAPRPSRPIGIVHRSVHLAADEITVRHGLRVTSPFRTLADLAARLTDDQLDACIQDLARRDLLGLDELRARLDRWRGRGRSGAKTLERAVRRHRDAAVGESFLETEFLMLLRRRGFPMPETQVEVDTGDRTYRVDCLYPGHDLVVELKGHGTHSTRADLNRDAAREAALLSVGLRVVSFTFDQVMDFPEQVLDRLGGLLASGSAVAGVGSAFGG